ncbi:MAG: SDR family oxidoreductase [Chloroflexota bacterium]|nr:MAG: SDR family oxidoreductase [Chloroflexota bacterium]
MRLKDKVAIVTGAAQGNGKALALAYVHQGAKVVVADMNLALAQETAQQLVAEGGHAISVPVDVSKRDQVEQMVDRTIAEYGQIDVLVNNAGITSARRFLNFSDEDWDRIIAVNLKGVFLCSQVAARKMTERGGAIINITSIAAETGFPSLAAYCASKAGVKVMTKTMAIDLGRYNIRVNCIGPGSIVTEMNQPFIDAQKGKDWRLERTPLGRHAQPTELTGAAIFLASDESSFVTGTTIYVDGGYLAW